MEHRYLILGLIAYSFRQTLDLDNNIRLSVEDSIGSEGKRVIIDFPNKEWEAYLDKWSKWRNAYKYRRKK